MSVDRGKIVRRIFVTLAVAFAGAAVGLWYAKIALSEEARARLLPMYGAAGALVGVLTLRLGAIVVMVWRDFSPSRSPQPPSEDLPPEEPDRATPPRDPDDV